jgi:signal peptidase I
VTERSLEHGPAKPQRFGEAVLATLTPQELAALRRVRWEERLTSPWASVTVLGLFFLVYLLFVESALCTYLWLQPVMKVIGVVCFGWWAAVMVAGVVLRPWAARKRARAHAEESLAEVEALCDRHGGKVKPGALDGVVAKAAALVQTLGKPADVIDAAQGDLQRAADAAVGHLRRSGPLDFVGGFGKALFIALLVRTVFLEPYKIPSGSMIPTLELGDQIFVNKFIYGVRLPFTNTVPFVIVRPPKRGDVIVFNNPNDPDYDYVKRVVGVPGDRIEVKDRTVTLNGTPLALTPEAEASVTWWNRDSERSLGEWLGNPRRWFINDWYERETFVSRELLDGVVHHVAHDRLGSRSYPEPIVVPEGSVFVLGDSRDNSSDSRYGFGHELMGLTFVPYGHIKGKATVIWLALGHGGLFSGVFGGTGLKLDRFFRPVSLCGTER